MDVVMPGSELMVDVWVRAGTEQKALRVIHRLQANLPPDELSFQVVGFDEVRVLWKMAATTSVSALGPAGLWESFRIIQRMAQPLTIAGPTVLADGRWSVSGHAAESDISEPGVAFLSFAVGSVTS